MTHPTTPDPAGIDLDDALNLDIEPALNPEPAEAIGYIRVSTSRQADSGLGIEAPNIEHRDLVHLQKPHR